MKDKVFFLFSLGPGLISTDPEETIRIWRTHRINLRLLIKMHQNETVKVLLVIIRESVITVVVKKYKDTSLLEPEDTATAELKYMEINQILIKKRTKIKKHQNEVTIERGKDSNYYFRDRSPRVTFRKQQKQVRHEKSNKYPFQIIILTRIYKKPRQHP